jgi:hypothetical protein
MADKPERSKRTAMDIKIEGDVHKGVYANKVIVAHSRDEFILDFVADFPPGPQIVARVITAPAHAQALLDALGENLQRYESRHGKVPRRAAPPPRADA